MDFLLCITIGTVAGILVFGGIAALLESFVGAFIAPQSKYPAIPRAMAMLLAWPLAVLICAPVLERPPFKNLPWGHVGELFGIPFFFAAVAMYYLVLKRAMRKVATAREARK